ncbi:MAG: YdcF family protein [Verrucomicrobia bacterium]|nr:YdcF family protein [Verrucomicrobiota bacterium]
MLDLALRSALTLLEPVGFTWACLLVLTGLLIRKKEFRLAALPAGLALFIWVIGATPLPGKLLGSIERPWVGVKSAELPEADVIVLLGGFSAPSREEVGGLHFNGSADRAVMALELVRLGKAKTLVIGGSAMTLNDEPFVEADLFREILLARQLGGHEIMSLGGSRNTRHEAEKVAKLAEERGWKRVLLVTSATHMRRAAAVFRTTTGLEVVPAPCAFLTSVSIVSADSLDFVPRSNGFGKLEGFLHEQIGWRVYRWRGWISDEAAVK